MQIKHPIFNKQSFTMLEKFRQYLDSKISLTADEWKMISSFCVSKTLDKGEFLLKAGEYWRYTAIVVTGCIRTYRAEHNGKIRILNFIIENGWAGDTHSLQHGTPSVFSIDAIEASEVILISKVDFEGLCKQLPHLNQLMMENLKECLSVSQSRIDLATISTAEEKYKSFTIYHAELLLRIPQYMIAAYLGITPESLSRIRKKLAKEQVGMKMYAEVV